MKRLMKILFFIIILSLIFSIFSVPSKVIQNGTINNNPIGSPGPVIAKFLEFYAKFSGRYYEQDVAIRDFEIQRKLLNKGNKNTNLIIVDNEGDGNFTKIQNAINYSDPGNAILVYSGNYNENIIINKPLYLIGINSEYKNGEDIGNPIISQINDNEFSSIVVDSNNVTILGFEIFSNNIGIEVLNSSESIFLYYNNIFVKKNSIGMKLSCNNSYIKHNIISSNNSPLPGIKLNKTNNSEFYNNYVNNFNTGIIISNSNNNLFKINNIINNSVYGIYLENGTISGNIFTLNNFRYNHINAYVNVNNNNINNNYWYFNQFGNYWDDLINYDLNNDGIGDIEYTFLNGNIVDKYPLINYFTNNPPYKPIINKDEMGILCIKTNELIPIYIYLGDPDENNLNYILYLGDEFIENFDTIKSDSIIEINNTWEAKGEYLVTVYKIQLIVFDEYLYNNLSDPYEIHIYDLTNIKNIILRRVIDNLIPSYFLTNWN